MSDLFLGVDLATASVRVLALRASGAVAGEVTAALPAPRETAPGRAEQEATYLAVVEDLLRALTAQLGADAGGVRALSLTGTSGSVVPCDSEGRPVAPALLYHDQRAGAQAARLADAGRPTPTSSPLARIGWLVQHAPAPRYLFVPDVVASGLLGRVAATDTSHALKAGIDPVAARWDTARLDVLGISEERLPELVHPGTELGRLDTVAAERIGLPPGLVLYAGMTDGCTAQVAGGAVSPGDTVGVLGTTLVLKGVATVPVDGFDGVVYSHYAPDGRFWPGGASNVGAGLVATEFADRDLGGLTAAAAGIPPAQAVRYPLAGTGERFPFHRPEATGFQVGPADTPAERFRTLLEGVAYTERLGLEVLGHLGVSATRAHRAVGGGSRNRLWNVLRATVLSRPVVRPAQPTSAFGAALLACASYTGAPLTEVTARLVAVTDSVEPDPSQAAELEDGYGRWLEELDRRGYLTDLARPTPQLEET